MRERRGNEANDRGLCFGRFDANFLRDIGLVGALGIGWDIGDWLGMLDIGDWLGMLDIGGWLGY